MGTRSDFYVGRGPDAEWLGSFAWDGYPTGWPIELFQITDEKEYRAVIENNLSLRRDATRPAQGWPWPWDDSQTTDYAYAFDDGKVWSSCFGRKWVDPIVDFTQGESDEESDEADDDAKVAVFPNMKARQNVTWGKRSGVIVITPQGVLDNG